MAPRDGQCVRCPCDIPAVLRVAISESGRSIAAFDRSGGLHLIGRCGSHVRALQEAPPGGGLCFAAGLREEVLYAVAHRVRVVDTATRRLVTTLLGHRRAVSFATSWGNWAVTQSQDIVILWKVSDWSMVRKLSSQPTDTQITAVNLGPRGLQVAALYASSTGTACRVAVWGTNGFGAPLADFASPAEKVDGCELRCLPQLALGDGFVAVAAVRSAGAGKDGHEQQRPGFLLVWHLRKQGRCRGGLGNHSFADAQVLQLPRPAVQIMARQGCSGQGLLYSLDKSCVCILSPETEQILQTIHWAGLVHLDLDACSTCAAMILKGAERGDGTLEVRHMPELPAICDPTEAANCPRLPRVAMGRITCSWTCSNESEPRQAAAKKDQSISCINIPKVTTLFDTHESQTDERCCRQNASRSASLSTGDPDDLDSSSISGGSSSGRGCRSCSSPAGERGQSRSRRRQHELQRRMQAFQQTTSFAEVDREEEQRFAVGTRKLHAFLHKHGGFPMSARGAAWQMLLRLPRNEMACRKLDEAFNTGVGPLAGADKEEDPVTSSLEGGARSKFTHALLRRLEGWFPGLAGVAWLRGAVEPVAQVFSGDEILAFEASACILLNWAGPWLDAFPKPPIEALSHVEEILSSRDKLLTEHLRQLVAKALQAQESRQRAGGRRSQTLSNEINLEPDLRLHLLWPMTRTLLAQNLHRDVWMLMWDHLVMHWRKPWLLGLAAASLLRAVRGTVLAVPVMRLTPDEAVDRLEHLVSCAQVVDATKLLQEFHAMCDSLQGEPVAWKRRRPPPIPLPRHKGEYPSLLGRGHVVLDHFSTERELARSEATWQRLSAAEARKSYRQLETVRAEESLLQGELSDQVSAERVRLALMKEGTVQHLKQRREQAEGLARKRMDIITSACEAVSSATDQQHELQNLEASSRAEQERRRRLTATLEEEAWRQDIEFHDQEFLVGRQLSSLSAATRNEMERRSLRQQLRAEVDAQERWEELESRQRSAEAQRERSKVSAELERQIAAEQKESVRSLRCTAEREFELEGLRRSARELQAARAATLRREAATQRTEAEHGRLSHDNRLENDASSSAAALQRGLLELRESQEGWVKLRRRTLQETTEAAQRSLERREGIVYQDMLEAERIKFEGLLRGARVQDELAALDADERLEIALEAIDNVSDASDDTESLVIQPDDMH